jgi:hypothetical protein
MAIVRGIHPTDGHDRQWRSLPTTAHLNSMAATRLWYACSPAFNRLFLRDAAASYSSRTAGRCCSQDC